jgi:hypothetical protein
VIGGSVTKPDRHDAIWGYPPPYRSVSPEQYVAGEHARNWPSVERVAQAVLEAVGTQRAQVGAAA